MNNIRRTIAVFLAINLFLLSGIQTFADNSDRTVKVMTYNMYLGADFTDIFTAQSPGELVTEVAEAFTDVQAGNVPERIDEIADQIETGSPDLVGLQEVALWRVGFPQDPAPATTVAFDFLQILLDRLAARGLHYAPVAIQTNLDAELTGVFSPTYALDIRYTDRVVILARTDLSTSEFVLENTEAQNFAVNLPITLLGTTIIVLRGWTSADVKHRGKHYRFINAHLESFYEPVQFAQAAELLQGPGNTAVPVILAGDFNSDAAAGGASYQLLTGNGFSDAWLSVPTADPGYTWALSGEIPNATTLPTQRVDFILTRGAISHSTADVVGESLADDLTPSGFRASDHAGVTASLILMP